MFLYRREQHSHQPTFFAYQKTLLRSIISSYKGVRDEISVRPSCSRIFEKAEIMTLDEIAFELELAGLSREQQIKLLSSIKRSGFDAKAVDKKLLLMGFSPIFTIYDDEDEEPHS